MRHFVKYHALGNDYLVVDPRHLEVAACGENARRLCDRWRGVGSDGVLFGPMGPVVPGQPVAVRTFNSDGSACARSGNGLRMFALYLAEYHADGGGARTWTLRGPAGDSVVDILDLATGTIRIGMGVPSFTGRAGGAGPAGPAVEHLTVSGRRFATVPLDLGTPNLVVPLEEVSADLARGYGPGLAGHQRFPQRTNVQFTRVRDRGVIDVETWERGAGYTQGSGASACAAAAAAYVLGLVERVVTVRMPGGAARVETAGGGALSLTSAVGAVAEGRLAPAVLGALVR